MNEHFIVIKCISSDFLTFHREMSLAIITESGSQMVIIKKSPANLDKTLLREHYMKMKKFNQLIIQPNYAYSSLMKNNCCEVA